MYLCPFCFDNPIFYNHEDFKHHVKTRHKHEGKSGRCPVLNCFKTFGSIYNYIIHVNNNHTSNETESSCQSLKRKNIANDDNRGIKVARISSTNISLPENSANTSVSNVDIISSTEPPVIKIPDIEYFDKKLHIDSQLSNYKKGQFDRAVNVVKELNATVTLPRKDIYKIISLFHEYQKESIKGLREIDPEISNNEKIDVALKFFESSFSDINTEYKTFKHLSQKNALVKPISKTIDISLKPVFNSNTGRSKYSPVPTKIQIVPMDLVLKKYLELPNVFNVIQQSLNISPNSDRVTSIIQSSSWKKFKSDYKNKIFIPLSIYFDDFEINNPLGSRKKKIGGVYYTISCIPPEFSSKLGNWFLAQFHCEADYKKLGNKKIFGKLKNELLKLKKTGINIEIEGTDYRVFFQVARVIGDNLGLNQLLGFATFSADFYCRICMLPRKECRHNIEENTKLIRNKINYKSDVKNSIITGTHSRGVNEECFFHPLFHTCDIITVDPFHDFEEGICRYEIPAVINLLMRENTSVKFRVDDINNNVKMLNFYKARGITIPKIKEDSIANKYLVLNGSEMSLLIEYLGIIIGKYIPRENKTWQLYILLRKIYFLVMAPSFTQDDIETLKILVKKHHSLYLSLNIGNLKPKHHFLLHYARAMNIIGPLRYSSAIRGEAVHRNSKRYARVANSRVNPCYTLATKYQLVLAKKFYDLKPMTNFCSVKILKSTEIKNLEDYQSFKSISPISDDEKVELLSETDFDGTLYKVGMAVVLEYNNKLPIFGEIKYLLQNENKVYFVVEKLHTSCLDEHVQAYIVNNSTEWLFVQQKELADYMPLFPQIVQLRQTSESNRDQKNANPIELDEKRVIVCTHV